MLSTTSPGKLTGGSYQHTYVVDFLLYFLLWGSSNQRPTIARLDWHSLAWHVQVPREDRSDRQRIEEVQLAIQAFRQLLGPISCGGFEMGTFDLQRNIVFLLTDQMFIRGPISIVGIVPYWDAHDLA